MPPSDIASAAQAAQQTYERDGVVALREVFKPEWIERLRNGVGEALEIPSQNRENYEGERFIGDLNLWNRVAPLRKFVLASPAGEIAGRVMGASEATFLYDQMLIKEPGAEARTPWHQDQPYWAVSGRQVCSIWTPLDPVSAEVSLEFVRGSHLWREYNPQHFSDLSPYRGTDLPSLADIEADRASYDIVSFDLEPGDCLLFQAMIVHAAPGNSSRDRRRRAYSTRWLGDDARFFKRQGEVAIPNFECGLSDGDKYGGEHFPKVWQYDA